MAKVSIPPIRLPWREKDIKSGDPDLLANYLKDLVKALQKGLEEVGNIININACGQTILNKLLDVDGKNSGLDADKVRGLPADFTCSKTANGYTKLPNGLIIQWGVFANDGDGIVNVTFPITFPNAALSVILAQKGGSYKTIVNTVNSITTTGFIAYFYNATAGILVTEGRTGIYMAIGY